ncbi:MAG: SIMPL domain-containing protein [Pseudomonadota bacterium]
MTTKLAVRFTATFLLMVPHASWALDVAADSASAKSHLNGVGEVLAQVVGRGTVRTKPDLATFRISVTGRGETNIAARAAVDAVTRDLTTKLLALGVDRGAIKPQIGGVTQYGFVGNEAFVAGENTDAPQLAASAMARPRKISVTMLEVQISDVAQVPAVKAMIEELEGVMAPSPVFSLRDESSARRAAIGSAMSNAKREAEAYAQSLGLRVDRIVRVYDQGTTPSQPQDFREMMTWMTTGGEDQVVTEVRVGMEVILAPR